MATEWKEIRWEEALDKIARNIKTSRDKSFKARNAKGELVGLLFDGTYESVSSDYLFDGVKTRSIHVDSRYMLWTMAEVDGAKRLLDEMGEPLTAPSAARAPVKPAAPAKAPAIAR